MILEHQRNCAHEWVAGMMIVHPADLEEVARARDVECWHCELVYVSGEHPSPWD